MPRKNRVTPFGELISTPARGTLMGNRGCLHSAEGDVLRNWARKAWVSCLLKFKGRHRPIMAPGQYTELFFLDEATALAAGHRPCARCRKARYEEFRTLWVTANGEPARGSKTVIQAIDEYLHRERLGPGGRKTTWAARLGDLPAGTFVALKSRPGAAWLFWQGRLHEWRPGGYVSSQPASENDSVEVLTPPSVVNVLRLGYCPGVHPSIAGKSDSTGVDGLV